MAESAELTPDLTPFLPSGASAAPRRPLVDHSDLSPFLPDASAPDVPTTDSGSDIPSKILSAVGSVLGAPKHVVDAGARAVARAEGMDVPDDATTGTMLRAAAGYDPGESKTQKDRVIGKLIEFGGDIASDPLTPAMMGAGSVIGPGAELAGTIANGAGTAFAGLQAVGAIQDTRAAVDAARKKGFSSPEFAEAATGAGLSTIGAALPFMHHLMGGEPAPAEAPRAGEPGFVGPPELQGPPAPAAEPGFTPEEQPLDLSQGDRSAYQVWPFEAPEGTQPAARPGEGFAPPEEQAFTRAVEGATTAEPGPPRLAPQPQQPYSISPEGLASGVSDAVSEAVLRAYKGQEAEPPRLAPARPPEPPPEPAEAPPEAAPATPQEPPAANGPKFAYRARDVGEQGIEARPGDHAHASTSEDDIRNVAPSRSEAPQEVVKTDLSKLDPSDYQILPRGEGQPPWVKFNRSLPEEALERVGPLTDVDRTAAEKAEPPLRDAVLGATPQELAPLAHLTPEAALKGQEDVRADAMREFSPEAIQVKRAALQAERVIRPIPELHATDDVVSKSTGESGFVVHEPENGQATVRLKGGGQKVFRTLDLSPDPESPRGQVEAATRRPPAPEATPDMARAQAEAAAGSPLDATGAQAPPEAVEPDRKFTFGDAARARIMARASGTSMGADAIPGVSIAANLGDMAIVGAEHIANGISKFSDWSTQMIKQFGDAIVPHLQYLWEASKAHADLETSAAEEAPSATPSPAQKPPDLPFNLKRMNLTPENKALLEKTWAATPDLYQNAKGGTEGKMTWADFKQSGVDLAGIVDRRTFEKAIRDGAPISDPGAVVFAKQILDEHARNFQKATDALSQANESGMGVEAAQRNLLDASLQKINYELSLSGAKAQAARTLNAWKILADEPPGTPIEQLITRLANESC